jgi:stage V sporulation protein AC
MTSAAMDYKSEGPIYGIGSNMFKLAGSVILYGVVSAWFFGMIRYLIGVIS